MIAMRWLALVGLVMGAACGGSSSDAPTNSSDAGTSSDAAPTEGGVVGDGSVANPITAPDDTWTWIDFPDSKCASGTPTGIAVNPHAGATSLMFYFEGGGSCSSADTCWGPTPGANNVTGYDATTFASAAQKNYPILNRADATNPFLAMNMVYVPYCTGDLHSGTKEEDLADDAGVTKPTYFWGAADLDIFLARLVPTFTQTKRIWMTGTSAGGFGTFLDFDHVTRAFGVRVDILDDSGPPILPAHATDDSRAFSIWGFVPPTGCASPCNSLPDVFAFDRSSQPNSQYGFLSFAQDTTISVDFGYTPATFPPVLDAFQTSIASDPNAKTFIVSPHQAHVVETVGALETQYMPWITQMVNADPAWKDQAIDYP
jgi:hypothetical protein